MPSTEKPARLTVDKQIVVLRLPNLYNYLAMILKFLIDKSKVRKYLWTNRTSKVHKICLEKKQKKIERHTYFWSSKRKHMFFFKSNLVNSFVQIYKRESFLSSLNVVTFVIDLTVYKGVIVPDSISAYLLLQLFLFPTFTEIPHATRVISSYRCWFHIFIHFNMLCII